MDVETIDMYAGFLQIDVLLGVIDPNLAQVRAGLQSLYGAWQEKDGPPLIVLPELWAGGFAYDLLPDLAARTPWVLDEMQNMAQEFGVLLAGSLAEIHTEAGKKEQFFNTLYIVGPSGVMGSYRKQHLFSPMEEDQWFAATPGIPTPVETPLGPVAALVCFDLRFADLARLQANQGATTLVVCGQWPAARVDHWRALLIARAVENQMFVVGCNRCGVSKNTVFGGMSMIIAPDGTILAEADDAPATGLVRLDQELLTSTRSLFSMAAASPFRAGHAAKIAAMEDLSKQLQRRTAAGQKIVFTNGCFDILHPGHVTYLETARSHGDFLVVGLNSDRSVASIKGPDRPVNRENVRAHVLAGLGCVDAVTIFDEDTPENLIHQVMPDVLVKGADWQEDEIVGADLVKKKGGTIVRVPLVPDSSTTGIVARIKKQGGC